MEGQKPTCFTHCHTETCILDKHFDIVINSPSFPGTTSIIITILVTLSKGSWMVRQVHQHKMGTSEEHKLDPRQQ